MRMNTQYLIKELSEWAKRWGTHTRFFFILRKVIEKNINKNCQKFSTIKARVLSNFQSSYLTTGDPINRTSNATNFSIILLFLLLDKFDFYFSLTRVRFSMVFKLLLKRNIFPSRVFLSLFCSHRIEYIDAVITGWRWFTKYFFFESTRQVVWRRSWLDK